MCSEMWFTAVTTDDLFRSVRLTKKFIVKGITIVGIIPKNKCEFPKFAKLLKVKDFKSS